MSEGIRITGIASHIRALRGMKKADGVRIEDGIRKCLGVIHRKADTYVPVDTGALKDSGTEVVTGSGLACVGRVEYGGETAPYALWVHQDPHATHAPPTSFKFLERAVRETRGTCAAILKRNMEAKQVKTIDGAVVS